MTPDRNEHIWQSHQDDERHTITYNRQQKTVTVAYRAEQSGAGFDSVSSEIQLCSIAAIRRFFCLIEGAEDEEPEGWSKEQLRRRNAVKNWLAQRAREKTDDV